MAVCWCNYSDMSSNGHYIVTSAKAEVILSVLFVCSQSFCHYVCKVTHECIYGFQPNMVDVGKG